MATLPQWKRRVNTNLVQHPIVTQALSPKTIEDLCRRAGYVGRKSFWSPVTTLLTFLIQVLSAEKTLRAAVAKLLTQLTLAGVKTLPSGDPTAYCQARIRLPAEVVGGLLEHVATQMHRLVSPLTGWLGRRVWVVDGSSVSMPDTPALQAAFPQPPGQKPGCGFPVAQLVALFCWTTGAIHNVVVDTIRPHELTLFRRLYPRLAPGDVVLADRAYSAYVDLVRLLQQGVDCVFRLHQRREANFRKGKRLGPDDRLVTWSRPVQWLESFGVSREQFDALPLTLTVRLVRITHVPRGFRSRVVVVVTTLRDPFEVPADAIRGLYRDRWTAELNLRSLKIALGMDVLRGESPDVVRKEIAMHLVAYNLIRLLMWHAARERGRDLHRLSFTGTLHRVRTILPLWLFGTPASRVPPAAFLRALLDWIARDVVPDRPNRKEPRRKKRRPKPYTLLTQPRRTYLVQGDAHAR